MRGSQLTRAVQIGKNRPDGDRIKVLLVDPDPISRHVLSDVLLNSPLVHLITSIDAWRPVKEWPTIQADVVILSSPAPANQRPAVEELIASGVRILLLHSHWTPLQLTSAIASGVLGCLVKKVDLANLVPAVVAVASAHVVLSQELTSLYVPAIQLDGRAAENGKQGTRSRDRLSALTKREHEVLRLLATGMTTNEVAAELLISATTVKSHVSHSLPKLGVRNRMEAVLLAQSSIVAHE